MVLLIGDGVDDGIVFDAADDDDNHYVDDADYDGVADAVDNDVGVVYASDDT